MTAAARIVCVFWALALGSSLSWSEEARDVARSSAAAPAVRRGCAPSGIAFGGELPL